MPKQAKSRLGRPPVNPPDLSERFMIRCSKADLELWGTAAAELGLSVGAWVRMIVHRYAGRDAQR